MPKLRLVLHVLLVGDDRHVVAASVLLLHTSKLYLTAFLVRIAGSAMLIFRPEPTKPILIAETILQGIGLSFLLFEVSLILLRRYGPRGCLRSAG
jgi:hypothetical protein